MHLNFSFDCRVFVIEIKCTLPHHEADTLHRGCGSLHLAKPELWAGFTGADSVFVAAGKRHGADETGWFEPNLDLTSRRRPGLASARLICKLQWTSAACQNRRSSPFFWGGLQLKSCLFVCLFFFLLWFVRCSVFWFRHGITHSQSWSFYNWFMISYLSLLKFTLHSQASDSVYCTE